ncbi:MAG: zf-HC2 domain-containing protein [Sedimentisphaerales bacterium]|nr:zf-HC2 domain-containing protein [Sedimentisphaerales bacterium]
MTCHDWKDMMMGYLDNELDDEQKRRFEEHLKACSECTDELREFQKLKEITDEVTLVEPEEKIWQEYWGGVYNRIERGLGWILLSVAGIILIIYGGFRAIEGIIKNQDVAMILKVGLLILLTALAILFVSVLRERIFFWTRDRYKNVRR